MFWDLFCASCIVDSWDNMDMVMAGLSAVNGLDGNIWYTGSRYSITILYVYLYYT